ncbi:MAG: ABC transporter ATP-binding protein [Rhizobiales bacterium]|nr:ABC transporter ATP-binding protein [Hyphomicrobiales bacterium]
MAEPAKPLVEIRNLVLDAATERGEAHVLRGLDLDIGRGRILGVVGESGSGKSTLASCLLRLLAGNVTRLTGEIRFDGTDLLQLGPAAMRDWRGRRIAMIFQDPMTALNPLFTVGSHLTDVVRRRYPKLSRRAALAKGEDMLTRVGIPDAHLRLAAYPHQLSGGMRQRVMIAMALIVEPDLLIADEPTTALDATIEAQIVALFDGLRRDFSGSILFISHHLGLVAELCDDLCVMYGGCIVETGPVAAVLSRPRHPYTRALLDCEIVVDGEGRLASIPGDVPDPVAPLDACIFAPRCAHAAAICLTGMPPLDPAGEGRRAACFRSAEVMA